MNYAADHRGAQSEILRSQLLFKSLPSRTTYLKLKLDVAGIGKTRLHLIKQSESGKREREREQNANFCQDGKTAGIKSAQFTHASPYMNVTDLTSGRVSDGHAMHSILSEIFAGVETTFYCFLL